PWSHLLSSLFCDSRPRRTLTPFLSSLITPLSSLFILFFFNDPAPTEIYTLSLHDALPISRGPFFGPLCRFTVNGGCGRLPKVARDRKSTRLNSSHRTISYAVFCLKKKKKSAASLPDVRIIR